MMKLLAYGLAGLAFWPVALAAGGDDAGFVRIHADDKVWQELRPGLSFTVIEGDPASDGFYILHARFASGTMSAPHFHPNDRFVTVLSGTWWTGIGPRRDPTSEVALGPGSFMKHPAGAAHYDGSREGETIVEIKGFGPAPLVYVDPEGKPSEVPQAAR